MRRERRSSSRVFRSLAAVREARVLSLIQEVADHRPEPRDPYMPPAGSCWIGSVREALRSEMQPPEFDQLIERLCRKRAVELLLGDTSPCIAVRIAGVPR